MMPLKPALLLLTITTFVSAKVYDRCELARELKYVHEFPEHEISTWICIVAHESIYDTAAMNPGSGDHGLFQISQIYWCSPPGEGFGCNAACASFRDDNIADDVRCAKRIFKEHTRISGDGFTAWAVYPLYCKGDTSRYATGCFENEIDNNVSFGEGELPVTEKPLDEDDDGYEFPPLPSPPKKTLDNIIDSGADAYKPPQQPTTPVFFGSTQTTRLPERKTFLTENTTEAAGHAIKPFTNPTDIKTPLTSSTAFFNTPKSTSQSDEIGKLEIISSTMTFESPRPSYPIVHKLLTTLNLTSGPFIFDTTPRPNQTHTHKPFTDVISTPKPVFGTPESPSLHSIPPISNAVSMISSSNNRPLTPVVPISSRLNLANPILHSFSTQTSTVPTSTFSNIFKGQTTKILHDLVTATTPYSVPSQKQSTLSASQQSTANLIQRPLFSNRKPFSYESPGKGIRYLVVSTTPNSVSSQKQKIVGSSLQTTSDLLHKMMLSNNKAIIVDKTANGVNYLGGSTTPYSAPSRNPSTTSSAQQNTANFIQSTLLANKKLYSESLRKGIYDLVPSTTPYSVSSQEQKLAGSSLQTTSDLIQRTLLSNKKAFTFNKANEIDDSWVSTTPYSTPSRKPSTTSSSQQNTANFIQSTLLANRQHFSYETPGKGIMDLGPSTTPYSVSSQEQKIGGLPQQTASNLLQGTHLSNKKSFAFDTTANGVHALGVSTTPYSAPSQEQSTTSSSQQNTANFIQSTLFANRKSFSYKSPEKGLFDLVPSTTPYSALYREQSTASSSRQSTVNFIQRTLFSNKKPITFEKSGKGTYDFAAFTTPHSQERIIASSSQRITSISTEKPSPFEKPAASQPFQSITFSSTPVPSTQSNITTKLNNFKFSSFKKASTHNVLQSSTVKPSHDTKFFNNGNNLKREERNYDNEFPGYFFARSGNGFKLIQKDLI